MNRTLLCAAMFLALAPVAYAQSQPAWPARPIRIIVPFGPGAFTDVSARTLAIELTGQLGQQVVVENRTGAGGAIGTELAARATPDGYTLLLSDNSFAISPGLYAKLPYDPLKDFIHVSQIAESPSLMSGRIKLPAKTLKELVSLARAKPGELTFGSGGQGSSAHLAMELFLNVAGVKMLHVPFKGIGPALAEAVADRIDVDLEPGRRSAAYPQRTDTGVRRVRQGTPSDIARRADVRRSRFPALRHVVLVGHRHPHRNTARSRGPAEPGDRARRGQAVTEGSVPETGRAPDLEFAGRSYAPRQ